MSGATAATTTEVNYTSTHTVFTPAAEDGLTYACDTAANVYSAFTSNGNLSSTGTCGGSDLAALSQDLGTVTSGRVTFAVGFQRDLAIDYLGSAQTGVHNGGLSQRPFNISLGTTMMH